MVSIKGGGDCYGSTAGASCNWITVKMSNASRISTSFGSFGSFERVGHNELLGLGNPRLVRSNEEAFSRSLSPTLMHNNLVDAAVMLGRLDHAIVDRACKGAWAVNIGGKPA